MSEEYPVGYKKPPKQHQYKPGQSGNPRGRPRSEPRNPATLLDEMLDESLYVTIDGRRKKVSRREAIALKYITEALAGDEKAMRFILTRKNNYRSGDLSGVKPDYTLLTTEELSKLRALIMKAKSIRSALL
jgi:hypothetical protein